MSQATIASVLYRILWDTAFLVGPPLLVSTVIAFVIGILQAVTQTQEQTLPQTVKMVVITLMLVFMGNTLIGPFYSSSSEIFSNFHRYYR
jgi:type III secretion protein S